MDNVSDPLQIRRMASPRSPEDRQKKRIKELDEKWKMLFNETPRPPLYSVDKYIEYLKKYSAAPSIDDASSKGSVRSNTSVTSTGEQVSYLLKKLKLDLKMSYERFLENFISDPNNGLVLLLTLLKNIQKTTREESKGTVRAKMQSKKRLMTEELECVMCIKFCLRYKESANILLNESYGLENVAEVLLSSNVRARCTALEIMSKILTEDKGFHRNLECFTYFRLKNCEPVRFKFLISMLMTAGLSSVQVSFQLCCMKFINSLLTSAPDGNTRIFLQSEIEMAGLDVKALIKSVEMKSAPEKNELKKEIIDFRNSLLDVDQLLESHETLYQLNIQLQQKVFELQDQIQFVNQLNHNNQPVDTKYHTDELENKNEDLAGLAELDKLLDSIDSESDVESIDACVRNSKIIRRGSNRNWRKAGRHLPVTVLHSGSTLQQKNPNHSDNDKEDCHFHQTENKTQAKVISDSFPARKKKIKFIEKIRAELFLALKQSVGLSHEEAVECLQNCNGEKIGVDNVNRLLNLLPTENEMRNILTLDCELDNLEEAEQFLVQIMSVERLEEKLKIMIFIDRFKSLISGLSEDVKQINESSSSLMSCHNFQHLVEFLKNYMVDNYYTTPLDFKVASLVTLETTSINTESSQNLLEYVVHLVYRKYPELLIWYKDLSITTCPEDCLKRQFEFIVEAKDGLKAIETEYLASPTKHLSSLHLSVQKQFDSFYKEFLEMEVLYKEACLLFRENPKEIEPQKFFGYILHFKESFRVIAENLNTKDMVLDSASEPDPDYMSAISKRDNDVLYENEQRLKGLSASDLNSFGLHVSVNDRERIQNWIVMTTPTPSMNIEVIGDHYNKQWFKSKHPDSDSGDSAFEGSGGRCLKKYVDMKNDDVGRLRTSTPVASNTEVEEPPPDYSRSTSPDLSGKHFDDLSSEVSRILRDFEGDLNGYETNLSVPINRRFYTIHSIIHL